MWNQKLSDVDSQTVYQVSALDIILTGVFSDIILVNAATLAETTPTKLDYTYTVRGVTVNATRVTSSLTAGSDYYLKIDDFYFSDIIRGTSGTCIKWINTFNSCSNQYFDWDTDPTTMKVYLPDPQELSPVIETESETIITEYGQQDKTLRINKKYRMQFVAPIGYNQLLNSLKINDSVVFESDPIINIEVDAQEQDGGRYSLFTLTYQIASELQDGNTCCDIINIDDIISPDNGGGVGECALFAATVTYMSDELEAILTDEPDGTPVYKWYRNGIYLSGASSIITTLAGDYRVEVRIGNCTAKASYYISDACAAFSLELTKVLNTISGAVSNVPAGETETYSVVLNGVEVATALPYTALASGIYYVYATAGSCKKALKSSRPRVSFK